MDLVECTLNIVGENCWLWGIFVGGFLLADSIRYRSDCSEEGIDCGILALSSHL